LPFEPIRLRVTIKNVGKTRLGPMIPIDYSAGFELKGPQDKDFKTPHRPGLLFDSDEGIGETQREFRNGEVPNVLSAAEASSVTFAFAADWETDDQRWSKDGRALTPEPGDYKIKCYYTVDVKNKKHISQTLELEVREPKTPDDAAVFEMLKKDPE